MRTPLWPLGKEFRWFQRVVHTKLSIWRHDRSFNQFFWTVLAWSQKSKQFGAYSNFSRPIKRMHVCFRSCQQLSNITCKHYPSGETSFRRFLQGCHPTTSPSGHAHCCSQGCRQKPYVWSRPTSQRSSGVRRCRHRNSDICGRHSSLQPRPRVTAGKTSFGWGHQIHSNKPGKQQVCTLTPLFVICPTRLP